MLIPLALMLSAQDAAMSISTVTGGMLASECAKEPETSLKLDACGSYILGVADALQLAHQTCHGQSDAWTLQTTTIVRRYIRENPKNWGWSAIALVRTPLMQAFPCPWTKYQKPDAGQ